MKKILPRSSAPARCGTSCAPQEQDFQISRFSNLAEPKNWFELASFQDLEFFLLQISRFRNLEMVRAPALILLFILVSYMFNNILGGSSVYRSSLRSLPTYFKRSSTSYICLAKDGARRASTSARMRSALETNRVRKQNGTEGSQSETRITINSIKTGFLLSSSHFQGPPWPPPPAWV